MCVCGRAWIKKKTCRTEEEFWLQIELQNIRKKTHTFLCSSVFLVFAAAPSLLKRMSNSLWNGFPDQQDNPIGINEWADFLKLPVYYNPNWEAELPRIPPQFSANDSFFAKSVYFMLYLPQAAQWASIICEGKSVVLHLIEVPDLGHTTER